MERLWAPWRMRYIVGPKRPGGECVFCTAVGEADDEALVLQRGETCFSILNAFPYNNGHLMVVPYDHVGGLAEVSAAAQAEMMQTAARWTEVLARAMGAAGFNLGVNLGAAAGAGIADHVHLHIVPRWQGDTNFMPAVAGVKVMPEDLTVTWRRLHEAWAAGDESG